jgi:hypothetical protein
MVGIHTPANQELQEEECSEEAECNGIRVRG